MSVLSASVSAVLFINGCTCGCCDVDKRTCFMYHINWQGTFDVRQTDGVGRDWTELDGPGVVDWITCSGSGWNRMVG